MLTRIELILPPIRAKPGIPVTQSRGPLDGVARLPKRLERRI